MRYSALKSVDLGFREKIRDSRFAWRQKRAVCKLLSSKMGIILDRIATVFVIFMEFRSFDRFLAVSFLGYALPKPPDKDLVGSLKVALALFF
jgi:hypothetical protein